MNRRNTVSVTPAIGASTVAGATSTGPLRISVGTQTPSGIACAMGLSQFFLTVNPLPASFYLDPHIILAIPQRDRQRACPWNPDSILPQLRVECDLLFVSVGCAVAQARL